MFSVLKGLSVLLAATAVVAFPVADHGHHKRTLTSANLPSISLNGWGGLQGLQGFDDFFGAGNFRGNRNPSEFIIVDQPVCSVQEAIIIQQQLIIVQEFTKQILLSQICEVDVQIIFLEQFIGHFDLFRGDIQRRRGVAPGFDRKLAGQLSSLLNSDGTFNRDHGRLDFSRNDIGREGVVFSSDWNDQSSPAALEIALSTARAVDDLSQGFSF